MPFFESSITLTRELSEVFAWFLQPALLIRTTPPELSLKLEEAPERLFLGAKTIIVGRRWGLSHRSVMEVTALEPEKLLVEEQRQGPFRRWCATQTFEAIEGGTCVTTRIDFEPPGGILGLNVTEAFVRRELERVFSHRAERLRAFSACGLAGFTLDGS